MVIPTAFSSGDQRINPGLQSNELSVMTEARKGDTVHRYRMVKSGGVRGGF